MVNGWRRAVSRLGAAAGIAGPAAFTGAWIASSLRQTRQGPGGLQLSGLAAPDARDPWIMLAGFLVLGGCTVAFGAALRQALRENAADGFPKLFTSYAESSNGTDSLVRAIEMANREIHEHGMRHPECRGMGSTIVAARISGTRLSLAHVGDSRAYLFRADTLQQLTSDHSLVAEQVRRGLMSHQQAAASELQSLLTRALGTEESVSVDADEIELLPGDSLLLCSDGLTRMVPENEIAVILTQIPSVRMAAERLVSRANEHGGQDNITVIVIRLNKPRGWFAKFNPWCSSNLV